MDNLLAGALEHIKRLLRDNTIPPLEGELAGIPELKEIHDEVRIVREILSSFSTQREEKLSALTESLCRVMRKWSSTMEALQESESRFKYLANHDPLTGAMNRRSFMERAQQELNDGFRHGISCGVIMMDVDHFKIFNDKYGHQAGDEVLKHIVRIISSFSRRHDFLGRYGGEEFIFFFCHADKPTSLIIAERIRDAIQNNPVELDSGPVGVTASLGIAMAEKPDEFRYELLDDYLDVLINNADIAMYSAKKAGRNRVAIFEEGKMQSQDVSQ